MPSDRLVVLLVDDQRFVGIAVTQLLASEADIQVLCCDDATEAIAVANRLEPAIILQDLLMPGIDGLTLVQSFRDNPTTAAVPVVVLSGNDDAATRARALAAGAADYLVKLPAKADLIACIRRQAGRPGAAGVVASPDVTPLTRSSDPQTLDTSVLDNYRVAGSAEFVHDLIDQFVRDARARVDTLLRSAARGSAHTTKATAHALKGSAAIMGALRLADLCDQLEQSAAASSPAAPMAALATQVEQELDRVCEALRAQVSAH